MVVIVPEYKNSVLRTIEEYLLLQLQGKKEATISTILEIDMFMRELEYQHERLGTEGEYTKFVEKLPLLSPNEGELMLPMAFPYYFKQFPGKLISWFLIDTDLRCFEIRQEDSVGIERLGKLFPGRKFF